MGRYLTRRYVAVDWGEAVRLARLDQTPIEEIRYAAEAELIHRTEWWAWWSDGLLTVAIGLPESLAPEGLSTDAVELITDVWESNSVAPQCGWALLAQVQRILSVELMLAANQDRDRSLIWEQIMVELGNGQQRVLYRVWGDRMKAIRVRLVQNCQGDGVGTKLLEGVLKAGCAIIADASMVTAVFDQPRLHHLGYETTMLIDAPHLTTD